MELRNKGEGMIFLNSLKLFFNTIKYKVVKRKNLNYKNEGFTLLEMMIVISIIGLISLLLFPKMNELFRNNALYTEAKKIASEINFAKMMAVEEQVQYKVVFPGQGIPGGSFDIKRIEGGLETTIKIVNIENGLIVDDIVPPGDISINQDGFSNTGTKKITLKSIDGKKIDIVFNSAGKLDVAWNDDPEYILDRVPRVAAAYGLRKLSSRYTGAALRVTRSAIEGRDIGYDTSGKLDIKQLSLYANGDDVYIVTWYDQSGNGRNITASSITYQPIIVSAGIINTVNGNPSLLFNGSSNRLTYEDLNRTLFSDGSWTALAVNSYATIAINQMVASYSSDHQFAQFLKRKFDSKLTTTSNYAAGFGIFDALSSTFNPPAELSQYASFKTASLLSNYINGVLAGSMAANGLYVPTTGTPILYLGSYSFTGGPEYLNGNLSEFILYNRKLTDTERKKIGKNQGEFYSIDVK